ncbi:RNA-guided endonuclease InsQ/TnpB family protein [Actinomadura geliboluensis]|uniref:Transposase n=1 Tax=Actinomadura geliboluensis TaxID=882440 RepID=A0A5S4GVB4_9ACTN|nr:RNA-guided endonuclease TnpB family protein [Actinomadura geliboluensis]TMR36896.1 transposase [Actinomadura geliboluensis]
MSRYRLCPTPAQEAGLLEHCSHARSVWNLAVEQQAWWTPRRGPAPGYAAQARQLTAARAAFGWLAAGSQTVQQQTLKDFAQAMANFFAGTHRRPTWRKAGVHEGFRIVGARGRAWDVRRLSRRIGGVRVPKVGWVRFRWSRPVPPGVKSFRVTRDRTGRWHVALRRGSNRRARVKAAVARLKAREADRRKDWVEKTSTDLARRFDVIAVEDLNIAAMTRSARGTVDAPGTGVRAKAALNRGILANGWGQLVTRLEHKAPGRLVRVDPAYTSQTCNACGHRAPDNRESQAVFRCVACGHRANADINAARNIKDTAVGRTVAARGGWALARPANREPQPTLLSP